MSGAELFNPAFGWFLSPVIATAAMALSSLSVVANANRRRRYGRLPLLDGDAASHRASRSEAREPGRQVWEVRPDER